MKLSYTRHAWERVGRLSLTPAEVADILDRDAAVNIGAEPGTNRIHRLFYSAPDDMCFVAVEDYVDGVVVTILPIDFHENIAWMVSEDAQKQARNLLSLSASSNSSVTVNSGVASVADGKSVGAKVFRITAYAYDPADQLKALNLGSWPCTPYEASVERLLDDDEFLIVVESRLASKGFERSKCEALYVSVGPEKPIRVSLTALSCEPGAA